MTSRARRTLGLLILGCIVLAVACARVRPLSGGAADEEPPSLLQVEPPDSSTGLPRQPELRLRFSENVSASSVRKALRFYPSIRRQEVRVKGAAVSVTFADSLPADTTLIVVVGEELQDQPPRNNRIAREHWLVFATGSELRSAAVLGRVAVKGKPEPKGVVTYEPVPRDTSISNPPPRYPLAATDEDGLFRMQGLPPGRRFLLRAFLDRNDNLQLDDTELVAAFPETLVLANAEIRRGIEWNLIDPDEPARVEGVAINHTELDSPVAVALRRLAAEADSMVGSEDSVGSAAGGVRDAVPSDGAGADPVRASPADTAHTAVRADTLRPLPLPVADRSASGWDGAYARLAPRGFVRGEWRVVYASPRGDYSVRVPPGRHEILAFVDVSRDSTPGLYVRPDSTQLEWEPLWVGGVLELAPGDELRPRAIEIESDAPAAP